MRHIDPNVVWEKKESWDQQCQQGPTCKQIEIPRFVTLTANRISMIEIPSTYIHSNIVYPDENEYSCDDEDLAAGVDPAVMQQLDIRRNLNSSRNYCKQYNLLNSIEYPLDYYTAKVSRLQRPLLRVFMRAQENDYRMNVAFRPSRAYKQKRQKRLNLQLQEFEIARQVIQTENQIALNLLVSVRQRELLKLQLIKQEEANFQFQFNQCTELFTHLKELRCALKEDDQLDIKENRNKIFEYCNDPDCAYQFQPQLLSQQIVDFMDEQYNQLRDKCISWPKNPTILSNWNVDFYTQLGAQKQNKLLVYTTYDRTLIIADRTKKNKKKVKLMLVDRNRASVFDGVRANYEHFYAHYQKSQFKIESSIELFRKELVKARHEQMKKENQLKIQQKREEQRQSLKFKLRLKQILDEPRLVKNVKIKHSDQLKFWLVKDNSTRISLKNENCQIVLK